MTAADRDGKDNQRRLQPMRKDTILIFIAGKVKKGGQKRVGKVGGLIATDITMEHYRNNH